MCNYYYDFDSCRCCIFQQSNEIDDPSPPTQYQNEAYTLSTDIESSKTITTNNFTVSSSGWAEFSKNIYPIGSVYITFEDIKPANIFGGTWELLKGGIFLCSTTEKSR